MNKLAGSKCFTEFQASFPSHFYFRLLLCKVCDNLIPLQDPGFGPDDGGRALAKRLWLFKCKTIKPLVRNMDVLYRQQAMEIVHWMASELEVQNDLSSLSNFEFSIKFLVPT